MKSVSWLLTANPMAWVILSLRTFPITSISMRVSSLSIKLFLMIAFSSGATLPTCSRLAAHQIAKASLKMRLTLLSGEEWLRNLSYSREKELRQHFGKDPLAHLHHLKTTKGFNWVAKKSTNASPFLHRETNRSLYYPKKIVSIHPIVSLGCYSRMVPMYPVSMIMELIWRFG